MAELNGNITVDIKAADLKNYCYNIDWDNDHGLGEQKCYVWENLNLKEPILPKIIIRPSKLDTKIPTRDVIENKIRLYTDYNIYTRQAIYIYEYICEDGYKIRSECRVPINGFPTLFEDQCRAKKQRETKNELIDKVIKHYDDMNNKEECNMNTMQFKDFGQALKAVNGTLTIESNGLDWNDMATIEVPAIYLEYFDIKMPTTEFCAKKNSTDWIEGLPAVKRVDVYNDRVVKVTFIDDTFTKSVCSENDHFDLDVGISICCMKRLLGKDGNKIYNDIIRQTHKVMLDNNKKRELEEKQKAEKRMKERSRKLKKAAKEVKAKEEYIELNAKAIIMAHDELEARHSEA